MNIFITDNHEKSLQIISEKVSEDTVKTFLKDNQITYAAKPTTWKYACHLFYLIIKSTHQKDPESFNLNQVNSIAHAVTDCAANSLEIYIHKHPNRTTYSTTNQNRQEFQRLTCCIRMFHEIFTLKIISNNALFDDFKLDYMIGVLAVISMKERDDFHELFDDIPQQFGSEMFFKFLMMIKGFNGFSKDFQQLVNRELIKMIRSTNGFHLLCRSLLVKSEIPLWQRCNMIAKIIESSLGKSYRKHMIDEIMRELKMSLTNGENDFVGACAVVLKDLKELNDDEMKKWIHDEILSPLHGLITPEEVLCGSILMEYQELKMFIDVLNALFSTSTVASMPSRILQPYVVPLFNLFNLLPNSPEKENLSSVIIFILNNSDKSDLLALIRNLRMKDNPQVLKLHPRVIFNNNTLQIGNSDHHLDDTDSFIALIKNSNNNFLIYAVFLCLINLLGDAQNSSNSFLASYDVDEDGLPEVLHRKFYKQLAIIEPLQEMIQWKALHTQFNENPREILDAMKGILTKMSGHDEQIVIIFFSIFKELLSKVRNEEQRKEMQQEILKLSEKFKNKEQIAEVFRVNEEAADIDPSKIAYDDAIKLMKSQEIYCKVYGSDTLIKLLKKRNKQAVINRHTILAVALQNMKESESYAYLNVIRLLVALTYVMDVEVIDALIAEFTNSELEIDERLKFGEVIVKVTEDLGQMSAKFSQQLINCFLNGSRDINDEFRTSSLANLGSICKLLSYQIHTFFHEMFLQLEIIIKCDNYLPSKRAATMVLSQVLAGLPSLMDFQHFLLPIYHLLKDILANEPDEQTRLHAGVGLDHLNEKTKDFLNPQLKFEKEIKIRLDENPHKIGEIKFK